METPPPVPPQQPPAAVAAPASDPSAGFWIRAGAYMIDGVVVGIAGAVTYLFVPGAAGVLARTLLSLAYMTVLPVVNGGQTVGKMAAGIAIIREDEQPLTYVTTFLRAIGYWVSTLVAGLGFVCAAFTDHKRALHDYIAGTRVVYVAAVSTGRKALVILAGCVFPLVAIVGIIAAIAIPRFASLSAKAKEGAAKGALGSLRAGVSLYYGDHEGQYPATLDALVPKYVQSLPAPALARHPGATGYEPYGPEACLTQPGQPGGALDASKLRDTGKWGYVADPKSPCGGMVFVDCTHTDSKGNSWHGY